MQALLGIRLPIGVAAFLLAACAMSPPRPVGLQLDAAAVLPPATERAVPAPVALPAPALLPAAPAALQPAAPDWEQLAMPKQDAPPPRASSTHRWRKGEAALQGWIGAGFYDYVQEGGATTPVDDDATVPTIGGGGQWKLAGEQIDFGLEGLLSFAWRGNISAFAVGGGGALVAVDVNMMLFELMGGPFANYFLGRDARVYAGVGPVLQWANYEQDGPTAVTSGDGDGFGAGIYARVGFEFDIGGSTMVGFGARWTDATIDLSGNVGDLELRGLQTVLTVSRGF